MTLVNKILILGAGQSAVHAASEIRKHDTDSIIKIFNQEDYLPYERPPLSKEFLMNEKKEDEFLFFSKNFFEEQRIELINKKIIKVEFKNKLVFTNDNLTFFYDKLLIATGSINRQLNFNEVIDSNILYLRNKKDAKKIKEKISNINNVAIIGGGFIGLEIASSLNQQNKSVNIIEISNQLMGRIVPAEIAKLVQAEHEKNGNKLLINIKIKNIKKINEIYKITLDNNISIDAEIIIAGVGSLPATELFNKTDLNLENGILTNEFCETSIKDIYAVGDVSNFYHPFYKKNIRLESYQHAQNHGISAGKNIVGIQSEYKSIPWMWSNQFNLNLQVSGVCDEYEEIIVRGKNIDEGIIYFFLKKEKIYGACGLGLTGKISKDIKIASKLIEMNIVIDKNILSNQEQNLKLLLKNK